VLGNRSIIAMAPEVRKAREIGSVVALAFGVVPEADGHTGKRARADELALLAGGRGLAAVIVDGDGEAQAGRLDLSAPDRADGIAQHEARDDVGTPRDRGEAEI